MQEKNKESTCGKCLAILKEVLVKVIERLAYFVLREQLLSIFTHVMLVLTAWLRHGHETSVKMGCKEG